MSNVPYSGVIRPISHTEWNLNYVWDVILMEWVPEESGGGGGGGGSVTQGTSPWVTSGTIRDGVTPATLATVFDRANANPVAVQLVDSSGDPVSPLSSPVDVRLYDAAGNALVSATAAPVGTERGLSVRNLPIDRSVTQAITGFDDVGPIALFGFQSATIGITTSNLNGTMQAQVSYDGGSTYSNEAIVDVTSRVSSPHLRNNYVFTGGAGPIRLLAVMAPGGTHIRWRMAAYASGTATAIARVTEEVFSPIGRTISADGQVLPPGAMLVGGKDTSNSLIKAPVVAAGGGYNSNHEGMVVHLASTSGANSNPVQARIADSAGNYLGTTGAPVVVVETRPSTAAHSNVTGTGASVQLAAANTARRGLTIYNASAVTAFIKFGTAASATSYLVAMVAGAYFEAPEPVYTGVVHGFWAAGDLRVTEIT